MHPKLLHGFNYKSQGDDNEKRRIGVHSLAHNTSGIKGHARASGWGLERLTSKSITHMNLHRPNKLVSA